MTLTDADWAAVRALVAEIERQNEVMRQFLARYYRPWKLTARQLQRSNARRKARRR